MTLPIAEQITLATLLWRETDRLRESPGKSAQLKALCMRMTAAGMRVSTGAEIAFWPNWEGQEFVAHFAAPTRTAEILFSDGSVAYRRVETFVPSFDDRAGKP